jgi:fumarate reductase flavoprotein subunit
MKKRWLTGLLSVLLILAVGFMGCDMDSDDSESGDISYDGYDVLVVGSGVAGSLAALGAKEAGAEKVLLIEKMSYYGGTSRLAGGGFSQYEAKKDAQEFLTEWRWHSIVSRAATAYGAIANYPFPDYDKLYSVAANIHETVDYLASLGIPFSIDHRLSPRLDYAAAIGSGAALMAKLEKIVKNQGIEVLMETKAISLITNTETGAVTGVNVTDSKGSGTIKAKNVILATGGFSQNADLVSRWAEEYPGLKDVIPGTDASAQGEGILMALDAGAVLYKTADGKISTFTDISGLTFATTVAAKTGSAALRGYPNLSSQIIVDKNGNRFVNEALSERGSTVTPNPPAVLTTPANVAYNDVIHALVVRNQAPYYVIFDSNNGTLNSVLDQVATVEGEGYKADSIAALATAIGANGTTLAATVNAYNVGTDAADIKKPTERVKPLTTGPYYAVKIYPQTLGSMGGVVTDFHARVLDANGEIIPHLYAVGETSNRDFYGQSYVGGGSLGLYSTMGRRAGQTAAKDL